MSLFEIVIADVSQPTDASALVRLLDLLGDALFLHKKLD